MRALLLTSLLLWAPLLPAEVPVAPGLRVADLAESLSWNGIPMQVRRFTTRKGVDEVLGWYRSQWEDRRGGEPVPRWVETPLDPWRLLTHREGDRIQTVQIRAAGNGAEGWLGEIALEDLRRVRADRLARDFPRMRGSELLNDVRSEDIGQKGAVIALRNGFSVAANADFYRDYYLGRGWHADADTRVGNGHLLVFRSGAREVSITIARGGDGRTQVVANPVSRGLLP